MDINYYSQYVFRIQGKIFVILPYIYQEVNPPAYTTNEDGTDILFRNFGTRNSNARNHPKERIQQEVNSFYFQDSKRDNCSNYGGITLLNSGYKTYTKIIAQCFKTVPETILLEEQNGFRIGISCIDNVCIVKQIMEKRRKFNLETHMAFLDLEIAFDRVDQNKLWQIINRRGIPYHLIEVIKSPYKNTGVRIDTGKTILEKNIY